MSSYTVTKKKNMDSIQFQVTLIIITFLSSFFIPFIILYPIQEVLFQPKNIWFFEAAMSTYFIFISAILFVSLVLLVNILSNPTTKTMLLIRRIGLIVSLIISCIVIGLCLNTYNYMNSNGIYNNKFFSLSEEFTSWEEITDAKQIYVKKDNITTADRFEFTLSDGSKMEVKLTNKLRKNKTLVRQILKSNNVIIESAYPEN